MAAREGGPTARLSWLAVLALLSGLLTGPAVAQSTAPAGADSLAEASPDSSRGPSARSVLWRSVLLPGWGQLATGHPVKAALFAGAAVGWMGAVVADAARVNDAPTVPERQDRAARRNTRILYYVLTATLAGLDAYVDRHLDDFDDLDLEARLDADPSPERTGARLSLHF